MNYVRYFIIFCCGMLCHTNIHTAQEAAVTPFRQTYKEGNHLPLIMLIEQQNSETPADANMGALTFSLGLAIQSRACAILVSKSILYNFVFRKQDNKPTDFYKQFIEDTSLLSTEWELYEPQNLRFFNGSNALYLLIPTDKKILFFSAGAFKQKAFKKIDLLPTSKGEYAQLVNFLTSSSGTKAAAQGDPTKDFAQIIAEPDPLNNIVWDIFLVGHGTPQPNAQMAGFSIAAIKQLLTYANTHMIIGTFLISSCYAGGENFKALNVKTDLNNGEVLNPLNYLLVVYAVGDTVTKIPRSSKERNTGKLFYETVFDLLRSLGKDKAHSIEQLLHFLNDDLTVYPDFIHAHYGIPQLILPGGILIQSLTPNERVMVIGTVRARAAELEKKPIQAYPVAQGNGYDYWLNLLLYPSALQVPLIMRASHLGSAFDLKEVGATQWNYTPSYAEFISRNAALFARDPLIAPKIGLMQANNYIYPNIISMMHGTAKHLLHKIVFEGDGSNGAGGVLKGIRDAFFDISGRVSIKSFFIDTVEGSNDIGPLLKAIQRVAPGNAEPLLTALPADWASVTLQQVFVETYYNQRGVHILFSFVIQNKKGTRTAWTFQLENAERKPPATLWHFEEDSLKEYELFYRDAKNSVLKSNGSSFGEQMQKIPRADAGNMQIYAHITINTGSIGIKDILNKSIAIPKTAMIRIRDLIDAIDAQAVSDFDFYPRYETKSLVINGKKMDPDVNYPTAQLPTTLNHPLEGLHFYKGFSSAQENSAEVVLKSKNEGQPDTNAVTIGEYEFALPSGTIAGSELITYLVQMVGADLTRHESKARGINLYKKSGQQLETIDKSKRYDLGAKGELHSFVIMVVYPPL